MLRFRWKSVVCAAVLASLVGCGPPTGDRPKTLKVTGTVTQKSQGVDGATVTFAPTSGGTAAVGMTDASGKFSLTTFEAGDGAMPGSYRVTVVKRSGGPTGSAPSGDYSQMSEAEKAAFSEQMKGGMMGGPPEVKDLLPAKYASADTSELTADVSEGGQNTFTFDLTE